VPREVDRDRAVLEQGELGLQRSERERVREGPMNKNERRQILHASASNRTISGATSGLQGGFGISDRGWTMLLIQVRLVPPWSVAGLVEAVPGVVRRRSTTVLSHGRR
jgi:hypothetical protein